MLDFKKSGDFLPHRNTVYVDLESKGVPSEFLGSCCHGFGFLSEKLQIVGVIFVQHWFVALRLTQSLQKKYQTECQNNTIDSNQLTVRLSLSVPIHVDCYQCLFTLFVA